MGSTYKPLKLKGLDESNAVESSLKSSLKYRASAEPFESTLKSLKLNGTDESGFGESIKHRALKAIERTGKARSILDDLDDQVKYSYIFGNKFVYFVNTVIFYICLLISLCRRRVHFLPDVLKSEVRTS